jgi:ABC-type sulfate transport system permease component
MGAFGTAFTLATRINVLPITIYTEFTNYANFAIAAALSIVLGILTWLVLNLARTFAGSTVAAAALAAARASGRSSRSRSWCARSSSSRSSCRCSPA